MLDINKCIWITGASTGIGKALALKLASEGFKVAVSARSIQNLKKLKKESKSLKGLIRIYPLNINFREKVVSTFNKIEKELGGVGTVILNAAINEPANSQNFSSFILKQSCEEKIDHMVDLSQLESPDDLVEVDENGHYHFTTETGLNVAIKPLTRGDEMDIEKNDKILKTKYNKRISSTVTSRLKRIIVSINGETDKNILSGMVENLVVKDSKKIREEFDKINPTIDMTMEVSCEGCGHITKGGIPIGVNFFWPEFEV